MSFIVKFKGISIHYSIPDGEPDYSKFATYLQRLTNLPSESLILGFNDSENDTNQILDQIDFEYFIENCKLGQITLFINLNTDQHELKLPQQQKKTETINSDPLLPFTNPVEKEDLTEVQQIKVKEIKPFIKNFEGQDVVDVISFNNQEESFSITEFDHQQELIFDEPKTENDKTNICSFDKLLKMHPDFVAVENQINELQSLLLAKLQIVNETVKELTNKKAQQSLIVDPTFIHRGVHCIECLNSPIVGKRFCCIQCKNFNLCEKCHSQIAPHQHQMIVFQDGATDFKIIQNIHNVLKTVEANPRAIDMQTKIDILKFFVGGEIKKDFVSYFFNNREHMTNSEFLKEITGIFK
jgi:hypothetical protein